MIRTVEKPFTVGKIDTYSYTVSSTWLGSETITSHNVVVDPTELTLNASSVQGAVIGASLACLTAGTHTIRFEWTSSGGRTDCATYQIVCQTECG